MLLYDHPTGDRELKPRTISMPHLAVVPWVDTTSDAAVAAVAAVAAAGDRRARLRGLVDTYLDFVARVLRNAGTPAAEVDDEVQRTFIIASRRLDDIRPGAEKSFLGRIALHLAAHAR